MDASRLSLLITEWSGRLARISEQESLKVVGSAWTRKQLLGHLIDSTANNHQRFVRLQQGDLDGFPGYDQEAWVAAGHYDRTPWASLVELWRLYNLQLVAIVEGIDPGCAANRWQDGEVDLGFLIEDFPRHTLHHLTRML